MKSVHKYVVRNCFQCLTKKKFKTYLAAFCSIFPNCVETRRPHAFLEKGSANKWGKVFSTGNWVSGPVSSLFKNISSSVVNCFFPVSYPETLFCD